MPVISHAVGNARCNWIDCIDLHNEFDQKYVFFSFFLSFFLSLQRLYQFQMNPPSDFT